MRYIVLFFVAAYLPCRAQQGLKDYYRNYFPIGVSVSARSVTGPDTTLA